LITEEWKFDHSIDYKTLKTKDELVAALKAVAPNGINMYFENVGGIHFAAAMDVLAAKGRVAICGQIENYNEASPGPCTFWPMRMIYTSQRIEGFISSTWLKDPEAHWLHEMHRWWTEGKIDVKETITEGIENWPHAFIQLFDGSNIGKVVVKV